MASRLAKWLLVSAISLLVAALLGVVVKSLVSWKALALLLVVLVPAFFLSYRLSKARRAYERGRYGFGRRVVTERTTLTEDCSACGRTPEERTGFRRRFVKELVVDGVPIALVESGYNDYCVECAKAEGRGDETRTDFEEVERSR